MYSLKPQKFAVALLLGSALIIAGPGCAGSKPQKSQKEVATRQWNDARSGVLGSLALDQYQNGNFDKSQATLEEALRLSPDNANLHILAAKLSIEQGKLEIAEAHLAQAKKLDPKSAEADYLSGVILQRWQQPQQAMEAYDAAVHKNPEELSYLMAKSEMLVALHREQEAIDLLRARVVYFEHSAAIRDAVGQLLVEQGKYTDGADMLREASILATDDQSIREHLAFALFYAKQYNEAISIFTRLLKDDAFAKRADIYGALGESQTAMGHLRDGRECLETAVQLDPNCTGYWLGLARIASQIGDTPRAELAVRKALSIEPANADAHCLLGYIRVRQQKFPQALAAFRMASQLDSTDTVSLTMQGYVLDKMGKPDDAIQCYAKALKIKPNDELASRLMASADTRE